MANQAANCEQEQLIVPIAYKLYKAHIKTAIYAEWIDQWQANPDKYNTQKYSFPAWNQSIVNSFLSLAEPTLRL